MNTEIGKKTKVVQDKEKFFGISTIIAVPALIIFLIFCIIPFFYSFINAFKEYKPILGIANSSWVGFRNFEQFLKSINGLRIIQNTFIINSLSIILGGIYVFLLTFGIASIKNKWLKGLITSLAILPTLIPIPILVSAVLKSDILRNNILINPANYRLSVVANEVFCIAPIAILAGTFACLGKLNLKKVWFITFGYVAIRFMLLFSSDLNYILTTYNPLVYETGDVIGTYVYRKGLLESSISGTSVVYIIKVLLQLIPTILGTAAIIIMSGKMQKSTQQNSEINEIIEPTNFGTIFSVTAIIPAVIFIWVAMSTIFGINIFSNAVVVNALANSFILSIISCALLVVFSLCLAYGMIVGNKIVLILNSIFLLLGGNMIGQYLQMRSMSLVNTYPALIILNCLYACIGAYFIYFAIGGINKISFEGFFRKSIPILVAMFGIGFARFYSNLVEPMIFIRNKSLFPVSLTLREVLVTGGESTKVAVSTIVLLLIPTIIGIASVWIGIVLTDTSKQIV